MLYVIGELFSCIFWGALIGIATTLALFYLPKMIAPHYSYNPLGFFLLAFGLIFLGFQSTFFIGGVKVKSYLPTKEQIVSLLPQVNISSSSVNLKEVSAELVSQYPMLADYVEDINIEKLEVGETVFSNAFEVASYYTKNIQSAVNGYLWRRVAWFMGAVCLIGFYFFNDASKQGRRRRTATTRRRSRMLD
ncbi:hypothetical protein [Bacteroides sp. 224]|uniref:hypothetical protein n=1 Tax=Bacteroides sp. 224 TaxID=2302936 RepID=UPI0013D4C8DC|nr:hypothetical protein [Bacteroides sp. 224]NDV65268.1 hypothetical protein [Bacteroides sp. 224]